MAKQDLGWSVGYIRTCQRSSIRNSNLRLRSILTSNSRLTLILRSNLRLSSILSSNLRGYIHLCWSKKSKNFLLYFLKVHILENLFPRNHKDLSSRTNLAAIDSSLSATASHPQVTLHERSRFFAYRVKCCCSKHTFSRTVNPISLNFGRLTYNNNSLWVNEGFSISSKTFFFLLQKPKAQTFKNQTF